MRNIFCILTQKTMAATPSNMIALGSQAPDFTLWNPQSQTFESLSHWKGNKGTVIIFMCNHCPYVIHILEQFQNLVSHYQKEGINIIAINSNDIQQYPEDAPDKMVELVKQWHLSFPYLWDETQETAKAYQAACTPDFYLYDEALKLVYRGQMDGARPGNNLAVTGEDLRNALDHLLNNLPPLKYQNPSLGCNIKWKE